MRNLKVLKNKVSLILFSTIIIGVVSTSVDLPDVKYKHLSGVETHTLEYFFYFCSRYIIDFMLILALLVKERTDIDKWTIITYSVFHVLGFASYVLMGWPEPKIIIIICFSLSLFIHVLIEVLKKWSQ